jgi:muramoyltetrapeptide carboxypeptidase
MFSSLKLPRWGISLLLAVASLSAQAAKSDPGQEGATAASINDGRFRNLLPPWVKTVAIISPASPADTQQLDAGLRLLKNAGIRVKVMPHARERENSGYISIEPEKRIADLEQAWLDPEVDLILCTRGGAGSENLLDKIAWHKLKQRDIPLVGFSNITALHSAMIVQRAGHPFSGPSLTALLGCDQESLARLRAALSGEKLAPVQLQVLRRGRCSGVAVGGHLMLLDKVSRTPFRPDTAGKIIFIECPGQKISVLRDKLAGLRDAGLFRPCAGIVFGHFVQCGSPTEVAKLLQEFSNTVSCPVFSGYPYGHASSNYTIDFRRSVSINETGLMVP